MRNFFMLISVAALVACGDKDGDSGDGAAGGDGAGWCADYFDALEGCYAEAGFSLTDYGLDEASYCSAYDGVTDAAVQDFFDCYVDAINAADCSTEEGITAMSTAASECVY